MSTRRRRRNYYASSGGGGGTITRTDNFNRADNSTGLGTPSDGGSAWVTRGTGTPGIVSNQAANIGNGAMWPGDTDGGTTATLTCSANGVILIDRVASHESYFGIIFRRTGPNDFWLAQTGTNYIYVSKIVGGVKTDIVNGVLSNQYPINVAITFKVTLTSSGFSVATIKAGTEVNEYTSVDATGAGSVDHGILFRDTLAKLDNFSFVGA